MATSLVFVIPVRHPGSVADWPRLKGYLAATLASIAAQTSPNWECVVVANAEADLPALPPNCRVERVDMPLPVMPDRTRQLEAYYDAVRHDKGLRIHAGLKGIPEDAHVMVVDFDDFVHRGLVEFVDANRKAAGWHVSRGYVWSGGSWCFAHPAFHRLCGTSHLIRRDLLGRFVIADGGLDIPAIKRRLGSHIFIDEDLAQEGNPLVNLPFPGAVYRIGNPQSTSGNGQLTSLMTPYADLLRHPRRFVRNMLRYRRMTDTIRQDFTLPQNLWADVAN